MKDCVDLTIGFLCDLAEVLSGHHSATKSAAQPETAMSPMGPPLRVRLAGEEEPDHGIAALAGPVTPALAVVLHGHEATAADPETGPVLPGAASSGAASSEAVPPGRGQAREPGVAQPPSAPYRRPGSPVCRPGFTARDLTGELRPSGARS